MPVTADQPAPYAPASAVIGLIERHRNKGLPSPVDADVLARAGISPSLTPRTLQALQILDLIDDEGKPTKIFEDIRLAPETAYKQRLVDWLNAAYADALVFVDPAKDDEVRIRDAFRSYKPVGQQTRMVSLFTGLYSFAGLGGEKTIWARSFTTPPRKNAPAAATRQRVRAPIPQRTEPAPPATPRMPDGSVPPAIAGLLASLPSQGQSWSKEERDRFLHTFTAVLDFCFPISGTQKQLTWQEDVP